MTRLADEIRPLARGDARGELDVPAHEIFSERATAEEAAQASERRYQELAASFEARLFERTRELLEANARLEAEAAERERDEKALRQAQKMEAVGQLASGLAHDFNNLLTAILGNLELLEPNQPDEASREMVRSAMRAAARGAKLNEQMLAFSRMQHLAPESVDLNSLVEAMADTVRRALGSTVALTTSLDARLWRALVDPTQIELAITNLATNGRDAMPLGGTLSIRTRNVEARDLRGPVDLAPGDYVVLSVADEGIGMGPDVLAQACEPFFTTRPPGKGSGLGLSQVYGVARQSGGGLQITSEVGVGTTVELYLPRSASPCVDERPAGPLASPGAQKRVCIVDDQEDVRQVAVTYLQAVGYRVAQASSGGMALDLLGGCGAIDVWMIDYLMPGMSGIELARALRARCPGVPIVIVTGYVDVDDLHREIDDVVFLRKPYRLTDLAAAIQGALARAAP